MLNDLKGKRMLLLAGTNLTLEAIEVAQRMGVWVGVTDYNEGTPAKKLADAAFNVSTTDVDALERLCHEQRIDGIFTNWIDSMLPWGARICERMKFPYPYTLDQIDMYTEKEKFKNLCISYGVPVPTQYCVNNDFSEEEINKIEFPVIVKPVDSSGSRGITVCHAKEGFKEAIAKALSYSASKHLIVEQYIDEDEITVNYVIENGKAMLTSIHDRYFNTEQEGVIKTPDIYIYPSRYTSRYIQEVNPLVIQMLEKTNLQNGSLFMQACVKDGKVYFYETGMRLNGCKIYHLVDAESDYNALERLIHFSLTGNMGTPGIGEKINPHFKHWYSTMSLLARPGTISRVEGLDELRAMPKILTISQWHFPGEVITPEMRGTLPQTIVRISLKGDTKDELLETIHKAYDCVKVYDNRNNEMLLTPHSLEDLQLHMNYELEEA